MTYCIYTDRDVICEDGSVDHVIPLSLGGCNQFAVWAERTFNSQIGSSVDGAIAKDPIVMFARRNADSRGHSNAPPIPRFKQSTIEGRPAQITFKRNELQIWDAKANRYLTDEEKAGKELTSTIRIEAYAPLRFLAKVVLGGGYFLYGDMIKEYADCNVLRALISFDQKAENSLLRAAKHGADANSPRKVGARCRCSVTAGCTSVPIPRARNRITAPGSW